MPIMIQNSKTKLMCGGGKITKMYCQGDVIYSSGNVCTYHVDTGITYQEEVDEGESCLSPKTFTPQKAGWAFVGWRMDMVASGDVLASKVMGDNPVTLYAVFAHNVTVTYYNGSTTVSRQTKSRYWNNGNAASPSFALTQAAKSGWSARGWSASGAANGGIAYANGATFTRDSGITLYGMYQQTVILSYNGNGATGGSVSEQAGIRYYNSNGAVINPTFTVRANAFSRSGHTFRYWTLGSTSGGTVHPGAELALVSSTTLYAYWFANEVVVATISAGQWSDGYIRNFNMPSGYTKLKLSAQLYWQQGTDNKNWGCIMIDTEEISMIGTNGLQNIVYANGGSAWKTADIYTRSFAPGTHYWSPGAGNAITCNAVNIVATI